MYEVGYQMWEWREEEEKNTDQGGGGGGSMGEWHEVQ